MLGLGYMEMLIVGLIALLLFGKNLPKVARDLGKSVVEFKKGIHQIEDDVSNSMHSKPESSNVSRPAPPEETVQSTAPKFEPPKSEPTPTESV